MNDDSHKDNGLRALENLRRKLLDLTSRNKLISLNHSKRQSLRVIDELPNQVVTALLEEQEMRFLPVPDPTRDELIAAGYLMIDPETQQEVPLKKQPTGEEWARHLGFNVTFEMPKPNGDQPLEKHTDSGLQTALFPQELDARLKGILQLSDSAVEEMGTNILYLAVGFLEWFDAEGAKPRQAPLFLLPVTLHKSRLIPQTRAYEYTLQYSGDDIVPNLSLREKLRIDFSMALPDLLDGTTPEEYFAEVEELVARYQSRWRIRRYISLCLLNFAKLLMYLDLDPERWPRNQRITDHPLVKTFLGGEQLPTAAERDSDLGFGEEHPIDEIKDIHAKYPLIDDADSSQHSAIIDAINGKNLVIEGPPGSGKSQTITNLIAAALAQGKSVLFVAEKLAALEVVKRRLDGAGIGMFCMELHSHKTQKRKIIEGIEGRLTKKGTFRRPEQILEDISRFDDLRNQLRAHVERVNSTWKKTSRTVHQILSAAARYRGESSVRPEIVHPLGHTGDTWDPTQQRRVAEALAGYESSLTAVLASLPADSNIRNHSWYGVSNTNLQILDHQPVCEALTSWQESLKDLALQAQHLAELLELSFVETATLSFIEGLIMECAQVPDLVGDELFSLLPWLATGRLESVKGTLEQFVVLDAHHSNLRSRLGPSIMDNPHQAKEIADASRALLEVTDENISLGEVQTNVNLLQRIHSEYVALVDLASEVRPHLPNPIADHLTRSVVGISEFKRLLEAAAALDPSHTQDRSAIFDNDKLDTVIPALKQEVSGLLFQRGPLQKLFAINEVPHHDQLRHIERTLRDGGLFRWCKPSWRRARRDLLTCRLSADTKLGTLQERLPDLIAYQTSLAGLMDNREYSMSLGEHFVGLDTHFPTLEGLRSWYKQLRYEYGVGFGPRVGIGTALMHLPIDALRGLRSLFDQGVVDRIASFISAFESIRRVLPGIDVLTLGSADMGSSADGPLLEIQSRLLLIFQRLGGLASLGDFTVGELRVVAQELEELQVEIQVWEKSEVTRVVLNEQLGLRIGGTQDSTEAIGRLQRTLDLCHWVTDVVKTPPLKSALLRRPSPEFLGLLCTWQRNARSCWDAENASCGHFSAITSLDRGGWLTFAGDNLDRIMERNTVALQDTKALQIWMGHVRSRAWLIELGFENLVAQAESGTIAPSLVTKSAYAGVFDILAREILKEEPKLGRFSGRNHESVQRQFRAYDRKLKELHREDLAWKIDQKRIPAGNHAARASERTELALLEHECSKKTRHIPLRALLNRAGESLKAIKPCFMMSPMSVAQYLAPGDIAFDLVVMDEASQIRPEDALGAAARGSQLVVVGDPKQLPPTSFFDKSLDDDDDDPTAIEESESILDATLPTFTARRLRWHYRSRHEKLIEFSNFSFYDSNLVLFPSPSDADDGLGIHFHRIASGCFVNRRNMEEARAIAEAVQRHSLEFPDQSLGIVAMNSEQREQIFGYVENLTKEDEAFRLWYEKRRETFEPVFIKNLENVQGDERDVIMISLTYGPAERGGKVHQRFGPINQEVGWRRLNVLLTRAKRRMEIFSSMGSEDVVAGPNTARGVRSLHEFLTFCETGVLRRADAPSGRPPDSDFEVAVMDMLKTEGFDCEPQYGVAGYFLDIAVRDPGRPNRFLMGIECDGATYHSAKSVRDRDRLRQEILGRLHWNIRRIWSTDWFADPQGQIRPIVDELHKLKTPVSESGVVDLAPATEVPPFEVSVVTPEQFAVQAPLRHLNLREQLVTFDEEVVRAALPETPEHKRLLRPAMLDALVTHMPLTVDEFQEAVPAYLRTGTSPAEARFITNVLSIINSSYEDSEQAGAADDNEEP